MKRFTLSTLTSLLLHLTLVGLGLGLIHIGKYETAGIPAGTGVVWYNLNPGGGGSEPHSEKVIKKSLATKINSTPKLHSEPTNSEKVASTAPEGNSEGEGKGNGIGSGEGEGGIGPIGLGGGNGNSILSKIKTKIARAKRYPLEARRDGMEGICSISFEINSSGSAEKLALLKSSGHSILDDEALSTIQRASPFPYYPGPIKLNLKYSLNQ